MLVRSHQCETVDALCQRVLGRTASVTETLLATNPGLADLGPILPMGTAVNVPDTAQATQTEAAMTQLWS